MENLLFISACVRGSAPHAEAGPGAFWRPTGRATRIPVIERDRRRLQPQYRSSLAERDERQAL